MWKWLAANGISLVTLLSLSFFAGISYSKIEDTEKKVVKMESIQDWHTKALIEILTRMEMQREKPH
jgi:hypothetical protein